MPLSKEEAHRQWMEQLRAKQRARQATAAAARPPPEPPPPPPPPTKQPAGSAPSMGLAKLGSAPRGIGAAKRARSETGAKPTTKKSLKGGKAAKAASEASASEAAAWLAEHDVSLSDPAAPAPCVRLADAPFPAALVAKLVAQPGFSAPTAVQGGAWPVAAAGDDLLAISRTGSGKTLSYSNPSASRSPSPNPNPNFNPNPNPNPNHNPNPNPEQARR